MPQTILHLERKFSSATETFIVNQVNTIKNFIVIVGTVNKTGYLHCEKEIIVPEQISMMSKTARYLSAKTANDIYNLVCKKDIKIIHTHYIVDALFFLKFTAKLNVPKICSAYGYDVTGFPNRFLGLPRLFLKKVFNHYDCFVAMSEDMKKDLMKIGCPESKIIIHYYGTDVSKFMNKCRKYDSGNPIKLLSVGTLEEKKAQHIVIDALNVLEKKYGIMNYEYHLVGSGQFAEVIKRRVLDYNLKGKVVFHGHIPYNDDRLTDFYSMADVFTLPSITDKSNDKEGIPGTVIEAMANGLPVVSTYHAGIPYVIDNEIDGLLVKERDVEGLAEAFRRLFTSKELRQKLGTSARLRANEKLDLKNGTLELEEIYNSFI